MKKFIFALSTLSGTIIGVGLFSLPYIASKVGIWLILGYFFVLGSIVILIHLLFGEVALKTPDFLRLPGYAKIYLGKWGEKIAFLSTILSLWGALLAYLIVGGKFFTNLFLPLFGGNELLYTILYFALGSALIYFGIRAISKIEFFALILFFLILAAILFRGRDLLNLENLFIGNWKLGLGYFFLPFGPILFSLWGADLIPEIEEMLGRNKILLKKLIPLALFIPIITYLVFIALVLGISGNLTSEEAIQGLEIFLGTDVIGLLLFFGILTTFTSFLTLGLTLRNVFCYDLKIPKDIAWFAACFIPLSLFFLGIQNFIGVISFVGGILLAFNGILIIFMYRIVKKIPLFSLNSFFTSFLIFILLLGIVYEVYYFLLR